MSALILYSLITTIIEDEKGKIKRVIFSAKRAFEKEDLIRLSGYASFDYSDKYGNDRHSLILIGRSFFSEYEDIAVHIQGLEIELDKTAAFAQMEILLLARRPTQTQEPNPLEYDAIDLKVKFKREEGGWKVIELEFLEQEQIKFAPVA